MSFARVQGIPIWSLWTLAREHIHLSTSLRRDPARDIEAHWTEIPLTGELIKIYPYLGKSECNSDRGVITELIDRLDLVVSPLP